AGGGVGGGGGGSGGGSGGGGRSLATLWPRRRRRSRAPGGLWGRGGRPPAAVGPVPVLVRSRRGLWRRSRGGGGGGGGRRNGGRGPPTLRLGYDRRWDCSRRREPFARRAQNRSGRLSVGLWGGWSHVRTDVHVRRVRADRPNRRVVERAAGIGAQRLLACRERDRGRRRLPADAYCPGRDPLRRPSG